jgi:alkanesulfonate monooxygenase SsuD/methylene tetrahydromethanopterin reductase-like flavin-dependent oxidoreductase (luciferase family)
MTPLSVLDLAPIVEGGTAAQAFRNSLDLAQHAERWGYQRYWLAEHHNMPGIASAATAVLIAHVASVTSTIRVGSGGVMLPNHASLTVAEQFGMLEALHPGRVDLGIGAWVPLVECCAGLPSAAHSRRGQEPVFGKESSLRAPKSEAVSGNAQEQEGCNFRPASAS